MSHSGHLILRSPDRDPIGEGFPDPRGISPGEIHGPNLTCFRVRIACSFYPRWVNSRCRLPELQHVSMGNCQPADIPVFGLNSKDPMSFTPYLYMVIPDFFQNRGIRAGARVREGGSVRPTPSVGESPTKGSTVGSKGSLSARTLPYVAGNDLPVTDPGYPLDYPEIGALDRRQAPRHSSRLLCPPPRVRVDFSLSPCPFVNPQGMFQRHISCCPRTA